MYTISVKERLLENPTRIRPVTSKTQDSSTLGTPPLTAFTSFPAENQRTIKTHFPDSPPFLLLFSPPSVVLTTAAFLCHKQIVLHRAINMRIPRITHLQMRNSE